MLFALKSQAVKFDCGDAILDNLASEIWGEDSGGALPANIYTRALNEISCDEARTVPLFFDASSRPGPVPWVVLSSPQTSLVKLSKMASTRSNMSAQIIEGLFTVYKNYISPKFYKETCDYLLIT